MMALAFVDIGPLLNRKFGPFEPFLGAGAGIARNRVSKVHYSFPEIPSQPAWTETKGGTNRDVAWVAMAGTAIRVAPRSLVEFAYRYSDYGHIKTRSGTLRNVRGGSNNPVKDVGGTKARLRSHGLYLGFRQEFLWPQVCPLQFEHPRHNLFR